MLFTILILSGAAACLAAPVSLQRRGNLPTPVSAATAISYVNSIAVADEVNSPAYERDYFKTWDQQGDNCDTRESVLKRDGTGVVMNSACTATSGMWYSDYDGETWMAASDVDIDHIVPLKEAWVSGARSWTAAQRESFANDITRPQLLAVTDNVNESKGDQDVGEWLPPREAYQCEYVRAYVQVKHYYNLSMDGAEKSAALDVLQNKC